MTKFFVNLTSQRKIAWFILMFVCLAAVTFSGCKCDNGETTEPTANEENAAQQPQLPQFSAEIRLLSQAELDSLGSKNDLPTEFVFPGATFAQVVYPERILTVEKGASLIEYIAQSSFQLPVKDILSKSTLAISSKGVTLESLKDAKTNEEIISGYPIPVEVVYLTSKNPIDKQQVLTEVFEKANKENVQSKTYGKFTVSVVESPLHMQLDEAGRIGKIETICAGVAFPTDNSVVFISGTPSGLESFFSDKDGDARGVAAQRLARTKLDNVAVAFQYDYDWDFPNTQLTQLPLPVTQDLMQVIQKNVSAFQFLVDVSNPEGNLLTLTVNAKSSDGANELRKAIGSSLMKAVDGIGKNASNAGAQAEEEVKGLVSLLKSVNLNVNGSDLVGSIKYSQEAIDFFAKAIQNLNDLRTNSQVYAQYDAVEESLFLLSRAFTTYFGKNKTYPKPICAEDGTPLLSWRVALLPSFGGQYQELYNQFKLDEPWNSDNNIKLLDKMPPFFTSPFEPNERTKTRYLVFNTPETPFGRSPQGLKLQDVADASRTLSVVFAASQHAVEWTKPETFAFNPEKPTESFGDFVCAVTLLGEVIRSECDDSEKNAKTLASLIYGVADEKEEPADETKSEEQTPNEDSTTPQEPAEAVDEPLAEEANTVQEAPVQDNSAETQTSATEAVENPDSAESDADTEAQPKE